MVMGIVICMVKRESVNIHSVPTTSNPMASVSNTAIKRKKCSNHGCTNNAIRNGVCISHSAKRYCTIPGCGKPLFQARKCRSHFWCLSLAQAKFDSMREDILAAANAMVGMRRDASATTSGSVVGGQKFHSIDHDATILDKTDLILELIQQYVGMNNWENVLAFASVCKSWKDAADQYRLKIGVELMEGGDGRKLNVSGFLSYLDQEKCRLAKTIYALCGKADKLFYCDVKAKCPRVRLLIHRQWLMMNGNTKFVVEGQSNHPCYRMYRHDCPYIDGVNVWIQWLWDRKYKLVFERQFGTDNTTCKRMRTKTTFYMLIGLLSVLFH
jgi:hypothetical protein